MAAQFIRWFNDVDKNDTNLVGGKGANLGEMVQADFPVPPGFIIAVSAYYEFVKHNNLETKIRHLLQTADFSDSHSLNQVSSHVKKIILQSEMPENVAKEVFAAYTKLNNGLSDTLVAVRSSATAEDLPGASFAGQQETYLNVKGEANVLQKVREGYASLYDARAMFYRHEQKYDHLKVGIAMVVQIMVASEKSGIMFTIDPVTNDKSKLTIEAIYGLGELIVQGEVTPDHYEVEKSSLEIIHKDIAEQDKMMQKVGSLNKIIQVKKDKRHLQKISNKEIVELAVLGKKLEKHYYFPQDSEWAIENGKVYLVQTRPITTINQTKDKQKSSSLFDTMEVLVHGSPASPGIASGPVTIIKSAKEIAKVQAGDVLVAPQTNPDYVPAMKKAVAIVTDFGGRTSHAAIVARELGIPAIVGTDNATIKLTQKQVVTVNGIKGVVYKGGVSKSQTQQVAEVDNIQTATKVYVNLAQPEIAEKVAKQHVDGVGLLRAEFIMANIGTHPKKFIHDGKSGEFINKLADNLEQFCKAFYPRPVVYRASDFKTNEYRNLVGGKDFEPIESNPMLGYRGAFRYVSDPEVFNLELEAIKQVRNKKKLTNLCLMIPFVRTVKELEEVKRIVSAAGLHRSATFKLWMMVEIPSNVILLDKFIDVGIDGVSIGSNDLTMLLLGTDRDNSEVAPEFNEQDESVLWALEKVIKTAGKRGITASLCGQAASTYPNLLEHLVQWGITSVSVSPDAVTHTRIILAKAEEKLISV